MQVRSRSRVREAGGQGAPNMSHVVQSSRAMTLRERARLVLAFARVLYVNGHSTDEIVAAMARLGHVLGLRVTIIPRWGELVVQAEDGDAGLVAVVDADPTGVDMRCVASTMRAVDELSAGR